jgi:hypothetical protein
MGMILGMMAAAAVTMAPQGAPQGARVVPGDQCFAITRPDAASGGDVVIGATHQVIRRVRIDGRAAFDIVVNQSVPAAQFAMRDHFVLTRADLTPIAFDSRRNGVDHVSLSYAPGRVTGRRIEKGATVPVDVAVPTPVWEGNLWGVTFGALPLAAGRSFVLPFYQYDSGIGHFDLTVTGGERVSTPTGAIDAWTVAIVKDGKPGGTALIAKRDGLRSPRGGTRLGGDCKGLD